MKKHTSLTLALALGIASSAFAQTEITVTGATAFRQATLQAIFNAYNSVGGGLGVSFNVAHDFTGNNLSQLIASNRVTFIGTFPGIAGQTVVRCSFNGSTEGLNAIAGNNNPSFLTTAAVLNTGTFQGGTTAPTDNVRPKFSFSDVYQSTSPITTPQLNPVGSSAVGVVTFAMVTNNGSPAHWTNVTQQQFKVILQQGIQPLSLFTGNASDTTLVLVTGRNDGSGTRSAYLTEVGYGVANIAQQYVATVAGVATPGTITEMTLVPQGGTSTAIPTSGGASNASTLWGNDVLGNGGYSSGSALRGHMSRSSGNCTILDGVNPATPIASNVPVLLLTWLSTADARNAVNTAPGGKILAFNGVSVTPIATGFNAVDKAKITNGAYSAWSYQHLYHHGSLSANEQAWRNAMVSTWLEPALTSTANGIPLGDMNVSRPDDGLPIVAPL